MKSFKTGIDNYGLYPLELDPMQTLDWAAGHGAEGVAFSGLTPGMRAIIDNDYLKNLKQYALELDLYLEWGGGQHIPREMGSWDHKEIFENNRRMAQEAEILGVQIVRSCSGGMMRWDSSSPSTEIYIQETAEELRKQGSMLRDHGVILALETHFEFTTFELLKIFERCEAEPGDYLGICLDTMNLLTMLEDPLMATERVLPWAVSTHFKDGGIKLTKNGFQSYPCATGKGIVNLQEIIRRLDTLDREIYLSIEDHGGDFDLPLFQGRYFSEFPDLSVEEFKMLIELSKRSEQKQRDGGCDILPREEWPDHCEQRMADDVQAVKYILHGM